MSRPKLSVEQHAAIRSAYRLDPKRNTYENLGLQYGVSLQTIWRVIKGNYPADRRVKEANSASYKDAQLIEHNWLTRPGPRAATTPPTSVLPGSIIRPFTERELMCGRARPARCSA